MASWRGLYLENGMLAETFLRENFDKHTTKELAQIIGRSEKSVHEKARRMGLTKSIPNWSAKEFENLESSKRSKMAKKLKAWREKKYS